MLYQLSYYRKDFLSMTKVGFIVELSNNKACFFSSIIDFVQDPLQTGDGHSVVFHDLA